MNLIEILQGANVVLKLLQARIVTILAMLVAAALFGVAMWLQTVLGLIIAATWGLIVFLPVLFAGRGGSDNATQGRSEQAEEGSTFRRADPVREPRSDETVADDS